MAGVVPPEHALPGLLLWIVRVGCRVLRLMQVCPEHGLNVRWEYFTDLPCRVVGVDGRLQVCDVAVCEFLRRS